MFQDDGSQAPRAADLGDTDSGCIDIDLRAVTANLAEIRRLAGARKVIATVKADAYGHGCVAVARSLQAAGVEYFAAGNLGDAAAMRDAGVTAPMLLLGALRPEMIERLNRLEVMPSIADLESAEALSQASARPVPVFVKVDCGFGRFGVPLAEAFALIGRLTSVERIRVEGIYTHNSFADPVSLAWAKGRTADFAALVRTLEAAGLRPKVVQALASPALFAGLDDPGDAVAIGHVLYGIRPVGPDVSSPGEARFEPALTAIRTRLVNVGRRPPDGQAAAYLRNVAGPTGVIPVGLCHGYRPTSPDAFVIAAGRKVPVLRVCLENTILDLSGLGASVGDEVLLLGNAGGHRITLETLAAWHGTSQLTLVTSLGKSLPRRYRA